MTQGQGQTGQYNRLIVATV